MLDALLVALVAAVVAGAVFVGWNCLDWLLQPPDEWE
jgi:hypothetical protein